MAAEQMTARDELARLFGQKVGLGERGGAGALIVLARLATDPETAPTVFRWLVEAGVLSGPGLYHCTTHNGITYTPEKGCDATVAPDMCSLFFLCYANPMP